MPSARVVSWPESDVPTLQVGSNFSVVASKSSDGVRYQMAMFDWLCGRESTPTAVRVDQVGR
jgi:hypothetical protein